MADAIITVEPVDVARVATRSCRGCGDAAPSRTPAGRCRACLRRYNVAQRAKPDYVARRREQDSAYRAKNRDKVNAYQRRRYAKNPRADIGGYFRRAYGLTVEGYDRMVRAQLGLCAICRQPSDEVLHVDHCHASGRVRGLLCRQCNTGLGLFKDDMARLEGAIRYLRGGA